MALTSREVDPSTLKAWLDAGEAVVVDVREPDEHARERIPGSRLEPLSRFDPARVAAMGPKIVLHCRTGRRSAEALARLPAGFHLAGGINAWKAAGNPVIEDRHVPISIMRQVQLTVGIGVLIGVALAAFVSPWFLLIPAFLGAGLAFAGATGMCGLAAVLSFMPWNTALRCDRSP
jgi:rhodanese-related sulfurtransferase